MLSTPEFAIYQNVSTITKIYPDFVRVYKFAQPLSSRLGGYELNGKQKTVLSISTLLLEDNFERSLRRSKTVLTDLVLSNNFDMFATFTFAKDRYDIDLIKSRMSAWLKAQARKHGTFEYLIVPEFHKDRKALHFHALFANYKGNLVDSKHLINGRKSYQFSEYDLGFNSCVKIDNIQKVGSYVKKYITKDMPQFSGKKRYWCSRELKRPLVFKNNSPLDNPFLKFELVFEKKTLSIFDARVNMREYINLTGETNLWQQISTSLNQTSNHPIISPILRLQQPLQHHKIQMSYRALRLLQAPPKKAVLTLF